MFISLATVVQSVRSADWVARGHLVERGTIFSELEMRRGREGGFLKTREVCPESPAGLGMVLLKVRMAPKGGGGTGPDQEGLRTLRAGCPPFWGPELRQPGSDPKRAVSRLRGSVEAPRGQKCALLGSVCGAHPPAWRALVLRKRPGEGTAGWANSPWRGPERAPVSLAVGGDGREEERGVGGGGQCRALRAGVQSVC